MNGVMHTTMCLNGVIRNIATVGILLDQSSGPELTVVYCKDILP